MTKISVKEAKERLPELLDEGAKGEEIVIAKGDGATYKITVVALETAKRTKRIAGLGADRPSEMSDDFNDEDPRINALFYGNA